MTEAPDRLQEPAAVPSSPPRLEDEKAIGTAHLAFGTSASFGGAIVAGVHIDGLLREPTIELDGRILMRDGKAAGADG